MDIAEIVAWGKSKMRYMDESPLETGFRYFHGLRVAQMSVALAESRRNPFDRAALYVGAFLHDVGKAGYRGPDHGPRGAEIVVAEALDIITPDKRGLVLNIIANHYMRPNSPHSRGKELPHLPYETLIVQDADILDHFGANALWLDIRRSVAEARNQAETIDFYYCDTAWQTEAQQSVNFTESRIELLRRIRFQETIYAEWRLEQQGLLVFEDTAMGDERNDKT